MADGDLFEENPAGRIARQSGKINL